MNDNRIGTPGVLTSFINKIFFYLHAVDDDDVCILSYVTQLNRINVRQFSSKIAEDEFYIAL